MTAAGGKVWNDDFHPMVRRDDSDHPVLLRHVQRVRTKREAVRSIETVDDRANVVGVTVAISIR